MPSAPTEVLIPAARQHRRQRYLRTGIFAIASALIIAGLIVALVVLTAGPAADGKARRPTATGTTNAGVLYIRPVLCLAAPYNPARASTTTIGLACTIPVTAQNLGVEPSGSPPGYILNNVPADLALAGVPSTRASSEMASSTVLLPELDHHLSLSRVQRYVLGPAQMTSRSLSSAVVKRSAEGQWLVDYTTTKRGAALWDKVTRESFHQLLALELDGVVYSAPIIQPAQASFTSFNGRGEISGNLTKADAIRLTHAINEKLWVAAVRSTSA